MVSLIVMPPSVVNSQ